MLESKWSIAPRDRAWIVLRERLAHTAREMHFAAISNDTVNGASLLRIAGNFAALAMSIPMEPVRETVGGLVDASTLVAAQMLKPSSEGNPGANRRSDASKRSLTQPI